MLNKLYVFFITHFTYGLIFTVFGPLIPYLSQETGLVESEFTYIFALRGVAYLITGLAQKTFLGKYCLYKRMLASCLFSGVGFILFELFYQNSTILAFVSFFMNLSIGSMEVLINVLLIEAVKQDPKQAVSFSYGIYGIGAVVGPILVSIFGISTLRICGILTIAVGLFYIYIIHMRNLETRTKQLEQQLNPNQQTQYKVDINPTSSKQLIDERTQKSFCFLFLLYAAITLSYRSWLPSFAVMEHITEKQSAALSISIYSGVLTGFRFFFTFWNPDTIKSLHYVSSILIGVLFLSLGAYWAGVHFFVVFGSAIILGMLFASYVPYLYALPSRYGKVFTPGNTLNTIIYYSIGEAVVSSIIGYLMEWIHPVMLWISLLLLAVVNKWLLERTIRLLDESQEKTINESNKEMETF